MENLSTLPPVMIRYSVGLDIACDSFDLSVGCLDFGGQLKLIKSASFVNDLSCFESMIAWVQESVPDLAACSFVMEATGVYYESLARWLDQQGYQVSVLLPNTVVAFARSLNIKTKNDQVDSRTLARMGCERKLRRWKPAPASLKSLKQLTRYRQRLVNQRTQLKNQHHASGKQAPVHQLVLQSEQAQIKELSKRIKEFEVHIRELIESDQQLLEAFTSIVSIPAIGETTAAILMAETQNFNLFNNQGQLVSYSGYDVIQSQSGTSLNRAERISKKGNVWIRKALFFPSIIAPKYIPDFARLYHRINEKQARTKMKGAVALQRKLLVLAFHLVKNKTIYDPEKHR